MEAERAKHLEALQQLVEAAYDEQAISYTVNRLTPKRGKELTVRLSFSEKLSPEVFNRMLSLMDAV